MKIIHGGFLNRRGIVIQCKFCKCVYMIENKKDWEISIVQSPSLKKYIDYQCSCPECGDTVYFGIDQNEYNKNEDGSMASFHPIFDRDDWEERYKLSIEEVVRTS